MQEDGGIGLLVEPGAHQKGTADDLLFRRAERDRHAAGNVVALHRLLDRIGGADRHPGMGVVAFHVAGRIGDQRLVIDAHGRLRAARQRIDFGDDDDLRLAGAPVGPNIGVHAGGAGLDGEADRFEHALDEFAALDLLHAELAEIVDGVPDGGDLIGVAVDRLIGERLASVWAAAGPARTPRPNRTAADCGRSVPRFIIVLPT
jgi:hypothetical protein